jgi:hypothetical protein
VAFKIRDLSVELIEDLDKAWPARCIKHNESAIDAHRYAGRRELIEELLTHLKRSRERPGVIPSVLKQP